MLRKGFAVEPQSLICLCPGGLVPGSGSVSRKMEAVFARNLFRRAKNSASFDCVRRQASFCMLMGVPWFCSAASTCSPPCKHCPRSVARPVLLGVFGPPKKEGHKFIRKMQFIFGHTNGQTQAFVKSVERKEHLECLGASVERPV